MLDYFKKRVQEENQMTTLTWKHVLSFMFLSIFIGVVLGSGGLIYVRYNLLSKQDISIYEKYFLNLFHKTDLYNPVEEMSVIIKNNYPINLSDEQISNAAINGIPKILDEHSAYISPEEYKNILLDSGDSYTGIGVRLTPDIDSLRVIDLLANSPAKKAGVQIGDKILSINHRPINGFPNDIYTWGTDFTLNIIRKNQKMDIAIKKDGFTYNMESSIIRYKNHDYAKITIHNFYDKTANDFLQVMKQIYQKSEGKLYGIVLDLRENNGGDVAAATDIASLFFNKKLIYAIIQTKSAIAPISKDPPTPPDASWKPVLNFMQNAPLLVWVSNQTVSSGELITGAFQDYRRGIIIGEKTYGKGTVQKTFPLSNSGIFKLTIGLYQTPLGRNIQGWGITPDILFNFDQPHRESLNDALPNNSFLFNQTGEKEHPVLLTKKFNLGSKSSQFDYNEAYYSCTECYDISDQVNQDYLQFVKTHSKD